MNLRLRQLDARLETFRSAGSQDPPRKGWVSEIRRALHMSATQLGKRLGITQQGVTSLEQAEAAGAITIQTLRHAARGLECELVYALVPRDSLATTLDRQAQRVATAVVRRTSHSMALEEQAVPASEVAAQVRELAQRLRADWSRRLWDDTE